MWQRGSYGKSFGPKGPPGKKRRVKKGRCNSEVVGEIGFGP